MKDHALKIAEMLETLCTNPNNGEVTFAVNPLMDIAVTIRDLVAKLDKAEPAILDAFNSGKGVGYVDGMRAVKQKPLSDEEIIETWFELPESASISQIQIAFARAIEERHGIK